MILDIGVRMSYIVDKEKKMTIGKFEMCDDCKEKKNED